MVSVMNNEVVSYTEMCSREGSLQRGMNFRLHPMHSVLLMSTRRNAPYADRLEDGGTTLIYEGHDAQRFSGGPDPKTIDQPIRLPSGKLTQNGLFWEAAQSAALGGQPERVHVYEKIADGIWSFNGVFHLVGAWSEAVEGREVFKFKLVLIDDAANLPVQPPVTLSKGRLIPSSVKLEVWRRDRAACVQCGARDELHFDHIVPVAKGGTSITAENVQLLCARHNLEKSAKIV